MAQNRVKDGMDIPSASHRLHLKSRDVLRTLREFDQRRPRRSENEESLAMMRQSVLAVVFLWSLLPAHSAAQRGGMRAGRGSAMRFSGSRRDSTVPLRSLRNYNSLRNDGYGYGWGFSDADAFDDYTQPGDYDVNYQNPIVSMPEQQSCEPVTIQPPSPPVRPEINEYKWPASSGDTAATFVLLLTDGSVRQAIAVWVQNNAVHYIRPEGTGGRVDLHYINREGTRMANAARHLALVLPAGRPTGPNR
jgi:hypothetical protein